MFNVKNACVQLFFLFECMQKWAKADKNVCILGILTFSNFSLDVMILLNCKLYVAISIHPSVGISLSVKAEK